MKITTEVEIGATHIPEDVDVHLEPVTYRSHEDLRDHVLREIELINTAAQTVRALVEPESQARAEARGETPVGSADRFAVRGVV